MRKIYFIALAALVVAACSSKGDGDVSPEVLLEKWTLVRLGNEVIVNKQPISLEFSKEGTVEGFAGCNQLMAQFSTSNDSLLTFSQIATTRMSCPEIRLEQAVVDMLSHVAYFHADEYRLVLFSKADSVLAEFSKYGSESPVNIYWKLTELQGLKVEMTEEQEREAYLVLRDDSIATGFTGCNYFNGAYQLKEENRIEFSANMGVTLRHCEHVGVDEHVFLSLFSKTHCYLVQEETLTFYAENNEPIAVFSSVYLY